MLDETGFYAPSVAHNALPGRPWPGISVFLGHNSTVSKQLRYSPARECVCAAGCPALTPRPPHTKKKKNLISKELHEKSVYSIMIVQENKTEDHEF